MFPVLKVHDNIVTVEFYGALLNISQTDLQAARENDLIKFSNGHFFVDRRATKKTKEDNYKRIHKTAK
jgi:hypothetical protein